MAGNPVDGELYKKIDGQMLEIKRQLRLKDGYPFDPRALSRGLQELITGHFPEVRPVSRAELAADDPDLPQREFEITVTSITDPTFDDLRKAYEWIDESVFVEQKAGERFLKRFLEGMRPWDVAWKLGTPRTAGKKTAILLDVIESGSAAHIRQASRYAKWMLGSGYRLAFPEEREAFAKAYPDVQRRINVEDPGTMIGWKDEGFCSYPTLGVHQGRRALHWYRPLDDGRRTVQLYIRIEK